MRCTSPRTVSFQADGKTLSWSSKTHDSQYAKFQLPCGKCVECRLEYARQWAIRCVHEAQMHERNSFVTLTYSDEHLKSDRLVYSDFQKFMKRLRKTQADPIGVFVTGEYGEQTKRPHWHALLFNWRPKDARLCRTSDRGDRIYQSDVLSALWPFGFSEFGDITFESAGYCARYSAKKLVHGHDNAHDFVPISKKSSKHAIGKKWLEEFWPDVFLHGKIILRDGTESSVPRYYEKWLKDKHPDLWIRYVTQVKIKICGEAAERSEKEREEFEREVHRRRDLGKSHPLTRLQIKKIISDQKFKQLQSFLKL